jgi:peptide chain release factor 2
MTAPGFWDNSQKAQGVIDECNRFKRQTEPLSKMISQVQDTKELLEMAEDEDEETTTELVEEVDRLYLEFEGFRLQTMLSGDNDGNNCYLYIHPGAGGTESCDWAAMLLRMYMRWCEKTERQTEIIDYSPGAEAGISSANILVKGDFAYGYLKAEAGVHRLVRISPFDANKRRHTSFASVFVYPEIADDVDVDIDEKDLRIDTYRSSGAGGQHVNVTDSAVRITHLPTGIVVQCQNERSQHKNKASAMKILRSRIYDKIMREKEAEMAKVHGQKKDIAWGSQIRSYVFQPYTMVKDHRTNAEVGDINRVMDGYIDPFLEAYLKTFVTQ